MVQDRDLGGVCWNVVQPARVCAPVHARQHAHGGKVRPLQQEAGNGVRRPGMHEQPYMSEGTALQAAGIRTREQERQHAAGKGRGQQKCMLSSFQRTLLCRQEGVTHLRCNMRLFERSVSCSRGRAWG